MIFLGVQELGNSSPISDLNHHFFSLVSVLKMESESKVAWKVEVTIQTHLFVNLLCKAIVCCNCFLHLQTSFIFSYLKNER